MLAGWSFSLLSASAEDYAEQPGEGNILVAQVGGLLNSGRQEPGNWGNGASVDNDCVLVKMSVKTENQIDAGQCWKVLSQKKERTGIISLPLC